MNPNSDMSKMCIVLDYSDPLLRKSHEVSNLFHMALKAAVKLKDRHRKAIIRLQAKLKELPTRPIAQDDKVFSVQRMKKVKTLQIQYGREIKTHDEHMYRLNYTIRGLENAVRKQHVLKPIVRPKRVTNGLPHCAAVLRAMGALPPLKRAHGCKCKSWPKCSCILRGSRKDCQ